MRDLPHGLSEPAPRADNQKITRRDGIAGRVTTPVAGRKSHSTLEKHAPLGNVIVVPRAENRLSQSPPPWFTLLTLIVMALPASAAATIELWPEGVPHLRADAAPTREENGRFFDIHYPKMTCYAPAKADPQQTAIIYCPGGGYERVSAGPNGGEVTRWLNELGITVFVLEYRNQLYGHPAPLQDVLRSVRLVRSRAAEFHVQPNHIGVLGGSAGGHLAASAATLFDAPEGRTGAELDAVSARPDFAVCIFSVITMLDPYASASSRRNLIGDNPSEELRRHLSLELQVTPQTSPIFIVHSQQDKSVVVDNSLLFYQALSHAGVPAELHLYPHGPHGSGMDPKLGPTAEWPQHCESWMRFHDWLSPSP